MPANLPLKCEDNLKKYLEDDLNLFENRFELPLTKQINVRKQDLFNAYLSLRCEDNIKQLFGR